jgi:hypothetical protein
MFNDWKTTNPTINWREYWYGLLKQHIELYRKLDFQLICLKSRDKRPVKGVHWDQRTLTYENALILMSEKMNLGVNLAKSELMVIDWDTRRLHQDLIQFLDLTMSAITPRGWHIYFKRDKIYENEQFDKVRDIVSGKGDMFRGGLEPQYTLVPLSLVTPKGKYGDDIGPAKCYEWVNMKELKPFSSFMEEFI